MLFPQTREPYLPELSVFIAQFCAYASYAGQPMLQTWQQCLCFYCLRSDSCSMEAFCCYLTAPSLLLWSAASLTELVIRDILNFYCPNQEKPTHFAFLWNTTPKTITRSCFKFAYIPFKSFSRENTKITYYSRR